MASTITINEKEEDNQKQITPTIKENEKENEKENGMEEKMIIITKESEIMSVIRIQSIARKWIARHHYLVVRKFVVKLQAIVRAWLVCRRLLESARLHAKRTRIFMEIISVEKLYVQDLFNMINEFKYPLLNKHLVMPADAVKMFSNIEAIYDIHLSLLDSLKTQRKDWNFKSGVGVCFLNELYKFEAYQPYIMNYDDAAEFVRSSRHSNPHLNKFLKGVEETKKMRNLELADVLITPVQRIPRYLLLLREYLKHTPPNHPDYELVPKLIAGLTKILTGINMMKRKSLNESKSRFLVQEVSGANLSGLTEYAMEGELVRTHVHFPRKYYVFLFEEMFIMAKHSSPEQSDAPAISTLKSHLAKMVNAKTYRFKLRKVIKMRSIAEVISDESDADGKTFILKIITTPLFSHDDDDETHAKNDGKVVGKEGKKEGKEEGKEVKDGASVKKPTKMYHFKASSGKAQMSWVNSISKLIDKIHK